MPQQYNPSGQDWSTADVGRSGMSTKVAAPKTAREVTQLKAAGLLATEKRFGAGGNKSAHTTGSGLSATKLEQADDVGTLLRVDKSLSIAIMQARTAKKLTQKELATAINEKPQVVAEYEAGKAIPNPQIISKLERSLGVKLPRPGAKSKVPPKTGTTTTVGGIRTGGAAAKPSNGLTRGGPPKRK